MFSSFSNKIIIYALTVSCGVLYTSSFSPIDFKFGMFLSLIIFHIILLKGHRKDNILLSYIFGISVFGSGVSWIYNSIYNYAIQDIIISFSLTILFVLLISLLFIPIGYFLNKDSKINYPLFPIMLPTIWVVLEFIRSNIFGGFPWLLVGTSQINTFFDYLYPLYGTKFVSFIIIYISIIFSFLFVRPRYLYIHVSLICLFLFFSLFLNLNNVIVSNKLIRIGVIQPNIDISLKYDNEKIDIIKQKYQQLLSNKTDEELIIFPETAIPIIYNYDKDFYRKIISKYNVEILSGIFRQDSDGKIYNSMVLINDYEQYYDKRQLVPFGEYTPFSNIFKPISDVLNIPMSNLSHGSPNQSDIKLLDINIYPIICYEAAYPNLLKLDYNKYGFIVNVSNDGWFGDSLAPYQHLQIAQSRALETGYPIIRSANTGITAIINSNGMIIDSLAFNTEGYIHTSIKPVKGNTFYMYFGDYPVLMLLFSLILLHTFYLRRHG